MMINHMSAAALAAVLALGPVALGPVGLALAQSPVTGATASSERGAIAGPGLNRKADAKIVWSHGASGRGTAAPVNPTLPHDPLNATPGCANGTTIGGAAPGVGAATGSNGASDNTTGVGSGTTC